MIHLTLTGYDAGRILCNADRTETDTYWHAMWCSDAQLAQPTVCPTCKALWLDDSE